MKRSEMVQKMKTQWLGIFSDYDCDESVKEEVLEGMSRLLVMMEYLGMKPPLTKYDLILLRDEHVWEKE